MVTLSTQFPTYLDVVKKLDPDGSQARIVEVLSKVNPILEDIPMMAGNLDTGHRLTLRTALATMTWKKLNQGTPYVKSSTDQYVETGGTLYAQTAMDDDMEDVVANPKAYRMDEDDAAIVNMNIEMVNALFYYSTAQTPERLQGFAPRFNKISGGPIAAGQIIPADLSASGANQTSIWLIGWGPRTVHGFFPKHSKGGITKKDMGLHMIPDPNGGVGQFGAWITKIKWSMGLVVADYRYVVRVCNIDTTRWRNDLSQGADLVASMLSARAKLFEEDTVDPRFYMNRATFDMLTQQLAKKGTVNFMEFLETGKKRIPFFLGIPIRVSDGLLSTEGVVV